MGCFKKYILLKDGLIYRFRKALPNNAGDNGLIREYITGAGQRKGSPIVFLTYCFM